MTTAAAKSKIQPQSLMTLEDYAKNRKDFRARVMEHKKNRTVHLGDAITLIFEDELTLRYQVQEMLRVERIFEPSGIEEELSAYNPLVPDGRNFKATMLIEYADPAERRTWLSKLIGIEDGVWVQVGDCERVLAIADEDLARETEEKTSAVHFLRFELTEQMAQTFKRGAGLRIGIDHPQYQATVDALPAVRDALLKDLS